MSDIEQRLDRLEKIAGASGIDIHEHDSPEQAQAWVKEREAASSAAVKQAEEAAAVRAAEKAKAELELAEAVNRAASEDLKAKQEAAAATEPEPVAAPEPVVETEKGGN